MPDEMTVEKAGLILHLKQEKATHHALYLEACDVYRQRFIEEAETNLKNAKAGGPIVRMISLPVPEEHTDDYDEAIAQLEWEVADKVVLSAHEFNTLVLGHWGWMKTFAANSISYTSQA